MNHQDFRPAVLRRKLTHEEAVREGLVKAVRKSSGGANKQSKSDTIARKIEDDNYKVPTVTHSLALQIQQARNSHKLTQKEFAAKCQVPVATVQAYENPNSTVAIESSVLQKFSRVLGVPLRKPQAPRKTPVDG